MKVLEHVLPSIKVNIGRTWLTNGRWDQGVIICLAKGKCGLIW